MSNNIVKSVLLFIVLALTLGVVVVGVLSFRSYFSRASGSPEPKNVRVANITGNGVNVMWDTSVETQGIVRYATDPGSFSSGNTSGLLFAAETSSGTKHEIKISSLKANTTYYYEIAIKDSVYDQSGQVTNDKHLPYSFTTSKSTASEGSDNTPGLDPVVFKQKFGTTDALYDLNKDGTVNSTDYLMYLSRTANPNP